MKYQITAPPSITEQEVTVDITDVKPVSNETEAGLVITVPQPKVSHTISGTTSPGEEPNIPPVANAGADVTIRLPINSVILSGSGSDTDGNVSSYEWTGNAGTIANPNQPSTLVSGLPQGVHVFVLTVTDNDGETHTDTVTVTVLAAVVVPPPVPGYELFYENGFDKTADLDPWNKQQYGSGYIDTAFKKTGAASFHAKPKEVSSGIRSEVQFPDGWLPNEGAIEFDINIVKRVNNNAHFWQIHPQRSGASACPGLWSRSSGLALTFKEIDGEPEYPFFSPVLNRWYTIRFEYKLSQNNTGYWRAYVDGVLKINKSDIRTQLDNNNWMKLGINSWLVSPTANEAYYDNLKVYKKQ